jgi:hypothetical protein
MIHCDGCGRSCSDSLVVDVTRGYQIQETAKLRFKATAISEGYTDDFSLTHTAAVTLISGSVWQKLLTNQWTVYLYVYFNMSSLGGCG